MTSQQKFFMGEDLDKADVVNAFHRLPINTKFSLLGGPSNYVTSFYITYLKISSSHFTSTNILSKEGLPFKSYGPFLRDFSCLRIDSQVTLPSNRVLKKEVLRKVLINLADRYNHENN